MLNKLIKYIGFNDSGKTSYSQSGEDLIVDFVLTNLRIDKPIYLDIGAHHPTYLSNTYYFYKNGATGICIEPDPELFLEILKKRNKDICINAGVGMEGIVEADFYVMSTRTLNTFSKTEAERYQGYGRQKIEKIVKIPLLPISAILKQNSGKKFNFISIDVEGMDFEIVKSFDLIKNRPAVFCIETITYTENNTEQKEKQIIEYMLNNEYMVYADTYINTIFVDKERWKNR